MMSISLHGIVLIINFGADISNKKRKRIIWVQLINYERLKIRTRSLSEKSKKTQREQDKGTSTMRILSSEQQVTTFVIRLIHNKVHNG